jgi:lipoate-protein ligase A
MQEIHSQSTNPYFNAALEYFLVHYTAEDCLLVYQNEPSVIIGKHQNAFAEANTQYLTAHKIPLVRRITGGGTVYHDLGNINICTVTKGKINFRDFLQPLESTLMKVGIKATITAKNDLFIGGEKITGTAAHIFKNKIIHHGTLLFETSQENLHNALFGYKDRFLDKSVKSRPSPTTNIKNHLKPTISIEKFINVLKTELHEYYRIQAYYEILKKDETMIQSLIADKFSLWEWNYGYSPDFVFKNNLTENQLNIDIVLNVQNGLIQNANLQINGKDEFLSDKLINQPFITNQLANRIHQVFLKEYPQLNVLFWKELLAY